MRWFSWGKREELKEPDGAIVAGLPRGEGELDVYSPTWIAVRKYAQEEIDRQRKRNDSLTADAIQTAAIRGRIKALKEILELPENKRRGLIAPAQDE